MDWSSLLTPAVLAPAVVAALVSGIVTSVGIWVSARTARKIHDDKLLFDEKQAVKKVDADIALAKKKNDSDIQLAEKKLRLDMQQAGFKRKADFAEEILLAVYKVRNTLYVIANPETRKGHP